MFLVIFSAKETPYWTHAYSGRLGLKIDYVARERIARDCLLATTTLFA